MADRNEIRGDVRRQIREFLTTRRQTHPPPPRRDLELPFESSPLAADTGQNLTSQQTTPKRVHFRNQAPGKLERLEENIGAIAVNLTSDDLREIESAASKISVQGARYPEHLERLTGR